MLMKLTPVVNFINILRAAFMHPDPRSEIIQSSRQSFCTFGISRRKSFALKNDKIDTCIQGSLDDSTKTAHSVPRSLR